MNTQRKLTVALSLCAAIAAPNFSSAASITGQGTWETTLQGRDLDGDLTTAEAYFDTVVGITWLADSNYAGRTMTWASANDQAASLDFNGITGWRLPKVSPIDGTTADDANTSFIGTEDRGYNVSAPGTFYAGSTASEMAHLFHNTLGNKGYCDPVISTVSSCSGSQVGWGLTNTGPFIIDNQNIYYWSSTQHATINSYVWEFRFTYGNQIEAFYNRTNYAWAVHAGDVGTAVSSVPIPATAWLFGSGLLGLIGITRRKKA